MIYGDENSGIPDISAIMQSTNLYVYCMNNPVMYKDETGLRNVVIVVGEDSASGNNTFQSNANTFIRDNPNDTVKLIYSWNYVSQDELINAISNAFGTQGVDALIIESHATTTNLIVSSNYSINRNANWSRVKFNKGANIRLTGCNSGGMNGEKQERSIAQYIAQKTGATVWAYTNNTSQKTINGGTYQKPVRMKYGQKVNPNYSRFVPILGPLPW